VAERSGGSVCALHVPMVVDSSETAEGLRREPYVHDTITMFDKLDRAIVGVGAWSHDQSALMAALPEDLRAQLLEAGATADICSTVLDADGREITIGDLPGRSIAITASQLRAVPDVVAIVGGGQQRAAAIRAALRSGIIHRLITDVATAQALLDL